MKTFHRTALVALLCTTAMLAACGNRDVPYLLEGTRVDNTPIALENGRSVTKKPLGDLTDQDIAQAAYTYKRTGNGLLYVVVSENAKAGKSADSGATTSIAAKLEAQGIPAASIVASTVPQSEGAPVVLIAFDTLDAKAPADCQTMPGLNNTETSTRQAFDYKLGCGVKDMIARQVAHTNDLTGVAGLGGENDGQRAANIVNTNVRDGTKPREYPTGYSVSNVGK